MLLTGYRNPVKKVENVTSVLKKKKGELSAADLQKKVSVSCEFLFPFFIYLYYSVRALTFQFFVYLLGIVFLVSFDHVR